MTETLTVEGLGLEAQVDVALQLDLEVNLGLGVVVLVGFDIELRLGGEPGLRLEPPEAFRAAPVFRLVLEGLGAILVLRDQVGRVEREHGGCRDLAVGHDDPVDSHQDESQQQLLAVDRHALARGGHQLIFDDVVVEVVDRERES